MLVLYVCGQSEKVEHQRKHFKEFLFKKIKKTSRTAGSRIYICNYKKSVVLILKVSNNKNNTYLIKNKLFYEKIINPTNLITFFWFLAARKNG